MKLFKYEYNDGTHKFTGFVSFFSGFNPALMTERKSFKKYFHKAYPNVPFSVIKDFPYKYIRNVDEVL